MTILTISLCWIFVSVWLQRSLVIVHTSVSLSVSFILAHLVTPFYPVLSPVNHWHWQLTILLLTFLVKREATFLHSAFVDFVKMPVAWNLPVFQSSFHQILSAGRLFSQMERSEEKAIFLTAGYKKLNEWKTVWLLFVSLSVSSVSVSQKRQSQNIYVERLKGQCISDILRATLEVLTFRKNYVQRLKLTRLENVL